MPKTEPEIMSIVLEGSEHDIKKPGVLAVNLETYRAVGVAGGYIDHSQDFNNHASPFDIQSLRFLRDDVKADGARRQAAGSRLDEIERILQDAKAWKPGETVTDAARKAGAQASEGGKV
jgi:hypothetical protein